MAITTPAGSSRRDFIRLTGTLGMAAGLAVSLAACGGKAKTAGGAKGSLSHLPLSSFCTGS